MEKIKFSCGACGCPCDEKGNQLKPENIPKNYNPDNYKHDWCNNCGHEHFESIDRQYVTREMAIDAGDPNLEGTIY